ncbi:uncharacterized protein LOC130014256 [Patella vulgata]|uniref:uncharacterized protein LOC130014256 n=1 Tax=Patella vulgata TaxID=6465 RepID=UPI0024A7EA69|nr:uncharacterized protein LOC130014256 [Patella vulgata]
MVRKATFFRSLLLLTYALVLLFIYLKFQSVPNLQKSTMFPTVPKSQTLPNSTTGGNVLVLLDVVITFPLLTDPVIMNSSSYSIYPREKMEERLAEYIKCLEITLSHPYVSNVHFLYDQPQIIRYIQTHVTTNQNKLLFHKVNDSTLSSTAYEFVFSYLNGRLVMVNQADVYPGKGLDLISKDVMVSNKLMYALTRHGRVERKCDMRPGTTCTDTGYRGSHDTYIFVPQGKLPPAAWNSLSHRSSAFGIDNVLIWTFKNILKYKVLNPCKVITMFHYHCSGVRPTAAGKRVNNSTNTGMSRPTENLM